MSVKVPIKFLFSGEEDHSHDDVLSTINQEEQFWEFLGDLPEEEFKVLNHKVNSTEFREVFSKARALAESAIKRPGQRVQGESIPFLPPKSDSAIAKTIKNLHDSRNYDAVYTLLSPVLNKSDGRNPMSLEEFISGSQQIALWVNEGAPTTNLDLDYVRKFRSLAEEAIEKVRDVEAELDRLRRDAETKLNLSAPSKLWQDRKNQAEVNAKSNFTKFSIGAVLTGFTSIVFAAVIFLCLPDGILMTPSCYEMKSGEEICKWVLSPVFGTVLGSFAIVFSIFIWFLKAFHSEYRQSRFDANYYSEKLAFAESYRSMKSSGDVSQENENIILSSLFREKPNYSSQRPIEVEGNPVQNIFNTVKPR